jgi:ribosomal protein S27E
MDGCPAAAPRGMTARPIPQRHWRSYGDAPLPTGAEALAEPFSAFPSWFMRIECDRCGKTQMVNEAHTAQRTTAAECAATVGEPTAAVRAPEPQLGQRHVAAAGVDQGLQVRICR